MRGGNLVAQPVGNGIVNLIKRVEIITEKNLESGAPSLFLAHTYHFDPVK